MAEPSTTCALSTADRVPACAADFATVYEASFDGVVRWAGALGCPAADVDDVAQEVFLIVRRKLARFDGRNLAGWLYAITARVVRNHRRRAWFRRVLHGSDATEEAAASGPSPAEALERQEAAQTVARLLDQLSPRRRAAFVLFEIEGLSGEEIASLQAIPLGTVWTRLHHARRDFLRLVTELRSEQRP